MKIDCTQCEMYQTGGCEDCLVTAVLHPPADVVEIDEDLDDPLRALAEGGLIPVLKFRPRKDPPPPPSGEAAADLRRPHTGTG